MHTPALGTVVANENGPTSLEFEMVVSESNARESIETGTFIQSEQQSNLVLGVVQSLRRTNRYFSSPDIIHGSSQGLSVQSVYPSERWDYLVAKIKVLGAYKDGVKIRNTKPVLPGSQIHYASKETLIRFLGLDVTGLHLGRLRQSEMSASINLDNLLQKHLAILSISGGGKSYTTSVLIEEILRRHPNEGRPALVLFDVHGEYGDLTRLTSDSRFFNVDVQKISSDSLSMAIGNLRVGDFGKLFPTMSSAQMRELSRILSDLRFDNKPFTIESIISKVYEREMNPLVKEALLGWLGQLQSTHLFSNVENPDLLHTIKPGRLTIIDLSSLTSLWKKRVILHYYLSRLFELRRSQEIPPVISFIEEAHQFAPETESSSAKSIIHTIAREGRKFLCSLVLISQRPVNLSTTALSQCNSHLIMRILNPYDLSYIGKTSEGINQETLQLLTTLGVGEALLAGSAVNFPIFIQVRKKYIEAEFDNTSLSNVSKRYEQTELIQR
ncbi:MAG: ATP-binding protein [Candidatus Heimdallarchaeota archaeon]|nr:ATP-binding protein [Candidatus Heimdallarchaeota archaeon]